MGYDEIFTFEHLYESYKKCCRNVKWKPSVQTYAMNTGINLYNLHEMMINQSFKSMGFYEFTIKERGKERSIKSIVIKERVMQRCLCDYYLVPALSKGLIYDNGASLKNKGYSFAVDRMAHHLRQYYSRYGNEGYVAKFDFKKYFDTIPHELVEHCLRRNIDDEKIIKLTMQLVESFGDKGLGLGSQVSQILAVTVPNELDHYIKDELGVKFYGRYMDDFYILSNNLNELKMLSEKVINKAESMGFAINRKKSKIRKINNTEFLKIRWFLTPDGKVIKKPAHESLVRMRRKLKKLHALYEDGKIGLNDIYQSWQSWDSHMACMHSHKERLEILHLAWDLFGKEKWKNVCGISK